MGYKTFTYNSDDIFSDIPGDSDHVNMMIPPEVMEQANLKEGDTIRIRLTDDGELTIKKVENGEEQ